MIFFQTSTKFELKEIWSKLKIYLNQTYIKIFENFVILIYRHSIFHNWYNNFL